jgi:molybdopterin converting factor small subunit
MTDRLEPITITVRLFAGAAEQAGIRTVILQLDPPGNVAAARAALLAQFPQLSPLCAVSLWATDTEVLDDQSRLQPNSELAMIPPVSGG